MNKSLGILLPFVMLWGVAFLNGQEINREEFQQRRAMIQPAGKVIFDFRPHRNGFIVVIANYGKDEFTFRPEEIRFRQGKKKWTPLYMTIAPDAFAFSLQFGKDVMPNRIKKFGPSEKITLGGGDWQSFEDLQADLQSGLEKGLWPFCFLAIGEPGPDYTRPIEIRVKGIGKVVAFDEKP